MSTEARVNQSQGSHFYSVAGEPLYEVQKKDGSGMRQFTLADARKMDPKPLPSVTTILKVLHKQALIEWMVEQGCLAVLTSPRLEGEQLDAFVRRILKTEKVQDQEAQIARDRGVEIHDGMEALAKGEPVSADLLPWIEPAWDGIRSYFGRVIATETILTGPGFAGRADLIGGLLDSDIIVDFKTTKKLPEKASWPEHRLQLSGYAKAHSALTQNRITTANLYISTVDCGKFAIWPNPPWEPDYEFGFAPLVTHWQWATGYFPGI